MRRGERLGEVFLPMMISTSAIFSTGEKKCMPMKCSGRADASARPVIGRVEVLEANTASGADHGLGLLRRLGLDLAVLEHRLDDELAVLERGVIGGRRDPREQRVALSAALHAALLHELVERLSRYAPCPCRPTPGRGRSARSRGRPRADSGDARAHQAGAETPIFLILLRRTPVGRRASLFSSCSEEQRADHAAASLRSSDLTK